MGSVQLLGEMGVLGRGKANKVRTQMIDPARIHLYSFVSFFDVVPCSSNHIVLYKDEVLA